MTLEGRHFGSQCVHIPHWRLEHAHHCCVRNLRWVWLSHPDLWCILAALAASEPLGIVIAALIPAIRLLSSIAFTWHFLQRVSPGFLSGHGLAVGTAIQASLPALVRAELVWQPNTQGPTLAAFLGHVPRLAPICWPRVAAGAAAVAATAVHALRAVSVGVAQGPLTTAVLASPSTAPTSTASCHA